MKNMLQYFVILLMLSVSTISLYSQAIPDDSLYLGQPPPGSIPKVFAPGIVSLPNREEKVISFSRDGKEIFFVINPYPNCRIVHMEFKNNKWTNPEIVSFSNNRLCDEPFFSSDGRRIYFWTTINGADNICYSDKIDTLWGGPINLGSPPNLPAGQYHPCVVADSSIYFASSDGKICRSQYLNGQYQNRIIFPYPVNYADIGSNWEDPYVSPDEGYMILHSTRRGGFGGQDIYISYKKADGFWTNPKNLGEKINTSGNDVDADITPDGKYMTYSKNGDLYWVSSSFVDSLKHTNFLPYVNRTILNQTAIKDSIFSYQIPDSTFIDDDGNNTLRYTATLSNGNPLPAWLSLNFVTGIFSGRPDTAALYTIEVTATDTAGASASCIFKITVTNPPTGIGEEKDQLTKGFVLNQNFPNPFNPTTVISYQFSVNSDVKLSVFDILGREVATLVNEKKPAGSYAVQWNAVNMPSGIYFYKLQAGKYTEVKKLVLLK